MEQVGTAYPDRDAQFRHINERGATYLQEGEPFVSVDCKKKENIGNFQNDGREYRRKKDARKVLDYDFPIPELGKVAPYGVLRDLSILEATMTQPLSLWKAFGHGACA